MSSYARANVRITNKKDKRKIPTRASRGLKWEKKSLLLINQPFACDGEFVKSTWWNHFPREGQYFSRPGPLWLKTEKIDDTKQTITLTPMTIEATGHMDQ